MQCLPRMSLAIACLSVPALVIAVVAVAHARREAARFDALVADSDRAAVSASVGARIKSGAAAARHRVETALAGLSDSPSASELAALADSDPWVRNAFRWTEESGVVFPSRKGATQEERRFLARYVTLFDEGFASAPAPAVWSQSPQSKFAGRVRRADRPRAASPFVWRTWFEGDRMSFIGWRRCADGSVVGAELETVALLAEIPALLESAAPEGLLVALRRDDGGLLATTGVLPGERAPDGEVSLAPDLPHRTLAFWRMVPAPNAGRPVLFTVALALALLALLAVGGVLLVWEARRERRESEHKTSFVSNVSHELKTPLTSIRLYAEMLAEGRVADEAGRGRYLDVIVKECGRLTRLVNNVLDFGRLEQNRRKYAPEDIDLCAFVREVADAQRARVAEAGMSLSVKVPDAPVVRRADRDALGQVLVNLVDNAVKYAADGKTLDLVVGAEGTVSVADRGPGIPACDRERVFGRFVRGDDSLTARASGSGLGLAIARGLARGMGGELSLGARPGGGAVFTVSFGGLA